MRKRKMKRKEKWLPIKGYRDRYMISSHGRIMSIQGPHGMYRKPSLCKKGYYHISLSKNGRIAYRLVSRLVAQAFIPNPMNKPQVNHRDGVKKNNIVSNLEWSTRSENMKHMHKNGLRKYYKWFKKEGYIIKQEQFRLDDPTKCAGFNWETCYFSKTIKIREDHIK